MRNSNHKRVQGVPERQEASTLLRDLLKEYSLGASRRVDKPLVLYGAGDLGRMAKEYFQRLGIHFLYVVDTHPERQLDNPTWKDIPVVTPGSVSPKDRSRCVLVVCIATVSYSEIVSPLILQGWQDIVPFYDITEAYIEQCPLSNGWLTGPIDDSDRTAMEYVLNHWDDGISRSHYLQFIAWHGQRMELIFAGAPVVTTNRYFIPEIVSLLNEREIFLDGGAHHGEVSLRFMDIVQNRFSKLVAVEPDRNNIFVLRERLAGLNVIPGQPVEIIECALNNKPGRGHFYHGLDYASQLCSMSDDFAETCSLDDLDIPVTFMKLHLEGWEYEALQGGMKLIKKYRPVIASTTYHKRNGLWQLPVLLMKELDDYLFLFRLHAWMGTGSVLYAIPRERYMHK